MSKKELTNKEKVALNKKYSAKLCWKQSEAFARANEIKQFFLDEFDFELPPKKFLKTAVLNSTDKNKMKAVEEYPHLINEYYKLKFQGFSFGQLYENDGKIDTFTQGHLYSKHRTDPVWNWRKAQLLRTKYRRFLIENDYIIKDFHPVHVVLTVPHKDGFFNGSDFYVQELINFFWECRRSAFWKKSAWGGEYGVEVKTAVVGLHIHIHSLVFLYGSKVNFFREKLKKKWFDLTGGTQVWAETLYFYKKDDNGEIIKELKLKKDLEFFNDDVVINNSEFYAVPKKFYVDDEKKAIEADKTLTAEEKHESIVNTYLRGILECIKYHFKNFEIFEDFNFYEKVLANSHGLRLYSRFGKLYKNSDLSFNTKKNTEDKDEELLNKANEISINPHTYEIEAGEMVAFFPSNQRRQPATSATPYELINKNDDSFYLHLPQGDIKAAMAAFLRKNKTKINKPIAAVPQNLNK